MEKWHDNEGHNYGSSVPMLEYIGAGFDKSISKLKNAYKEKSDANEVEYLKGLEYAIELLEHHKRNWYNE